MALLVAGLLMASFCVSSRTAPAFYLPELLDTLVVRYIVANGEAHPVAVVQGRLCYQPYVPVCRSGISLCRLLATELLRPTHEEVDTNTDAQE